MTMLAFHGDPAIKRKYLARVRAHRAADELIHGIYWKDGKGCAVGCTIHSAQHSHYETELGIPVALASLEDRMFEAMENGRAKDWPVRFLEAIPVGADLSGVVPAFLSWLMLDETYGVAFTTQDEKVADLAAEVGLRYAANDTMGDEAIDLANRLWDARDARAARAARAAWVAWAARDARVAWDARDAWAAWAARIARTAWDAWDARTAFIIASTEHLLKLLATAPVPKPRRGTRLAPRK